MGESNGGAPFNAYFINLKPADMFVASRASDRFFRFVRFVGKTADGAWALAELSPLGEECRPTFTAEKFVAAFAGARVERLGPLTDRDWEMFGGFLRFMAEYGLGPDELARCFVLFTHMHRAIAEMAAHRRSG